jgi:hypothetical protein
MVAERLVEDEALVLPMDEETGAIVPWLDDPYYEVGAFLLGLRDDDTTEEVPR